MKTNAKINYSFPVTVGSNGRYTIYVGEVPLRDIPKITTVIPFDLDAGIDAMNEGMQRWTSIERATRMGKNMDHELASGQSVDFQSLLAVTLKNSCPVYKYDDKARTLQLFEPTPVIDGYHRCEEVEIILENKKKFPQMAKYCQEATVTIRIIADATPQDCQKYFTDANDKRKQIEPSLTSSLSAVHTWGLFETANGDPKVRAKKIEQAVLLRVCDEQRKEEGNPFYGFIDFGHSKALNTTEEMGKPPKATEQVRTCHQLYLALLAGHYIEPNPKTPENLLAQVTIVKNTLDGWWQIVQDNLPRCFETPDADEEISPIRNAGAKVINQVCGAFFWFIADVSKKKFRQVNNRGQVDLDLALAFARVLMSQKKSALSKGKEDTWSYIDTSSGAINDKVRGVWASLKPTPTITKTWCKDGIIGKWNPYSIKKKRTK
jgi:hypothetical protein